MIISEKPHAWKNRHITSIGPIQPKMSSQRTQKQMLGERRKSRRRTSNLQHLLNLFFSVSVPLQLSSFRSQRLQLSASHEISISSIQLLLNPHVKCSDILQTRGREQKIPYSWPEYCVKKTHSLTRFQSFTFQCHSTVVVLGLKENKQLFPVHCLRSSHKFICHLYLSAVSLPGYEMQKDCYYGSLIILKCC